VDLVDRSLAAKQQAAEDIRSRNGDERRGPANVLVQGAMEIRVPNHRAEPMLDLSCQAKKASEIPLLRKSDDHSSSLADVATLPDAALVQRSHETKTDGT
jgi:hypothetical protein